MTMQAPGRYLAKSTCHHPEHNKPCQIAGHYRGPMTVEISDEVSGQQERVALVPFTHMDCVVYYHVPFVGVVIVRGVSEEEADKEAQRQIHEALAKQYVSHTKEIMNMEIIMESQL